jgi:cyclophilin family peptidyl-prolyl cis-trans isomerase
MARARRKTLLVAAIGPPLLAALAATGGCGVEATDTTGSHTVFRSMRSDLAEAETAPPIELEALEEWNWPDGEHSRAFVEVSGLGTIEIELFPELAPETVANFRKLAAEGFYDATTFHRVIPSFMIQGGDAHSRNDDPTDDGSGGPGYTIPDEFSRAPHLRGAVSMANRGAPNSGGSQFFIVHADSQHLDNQYALFGRVVSGMDIVDRITEVERDTAGRWGPKNRPLEPVLMNRVWVAPSGTPDSFASASEDTAPPASPQH